MMPSGFAHVPLRAVPAASPSRRRAQAWRSLFIAPCALLGFTWRKPSGIPAATVFRPWCFSQFQLSFQAKPRRYLALSAKFAKPKGISVEVEMVLNRSGGEVKGQAGEFIFEILNLRSEIFEQAGGMI